MSATPNPVLYPFPVALPGGDLRSIRILHGDAAWYRQKTISRLAAKAYIDDNGCWRWSGVLDRSGYGHFTFARRQTRAHRASWEVFNGPVPDGLELDHLCNVRDCINPAHLEPVTRQENLRRRSIRQTHCKWGHPYDAVNTYVRPDGTGRDCRTCRAAADKRRQPSRRKAA